MPGSYWTTCRRQSTLLQQEPSLAGIALATSWQTLLSNAPDHEMALALGFGAWLWAVDCLGGEAGQPPARRADAVGTATERPGSAASSAGARWLPSHRVAVDLPGSACARHGALPFRP